MALIKQVLNFEVAMQAGKKHIGAVVKNAARAASLKKVLIKNSNTPAAAGRQRFSRIV
jgi:hypothetical protein